MKDLSVIIPYVQEYPQIVFTLQSLYCELEDAGIDFEIIAIDNWCKEVEAQGRPQDKGSGYVKDRANALPWLKYVAYDEKLSHWQAKNAGIKESTGRNLLFIDSHCITSANSVVDMFHYYDAHKDDLNGTLHLPISYMMERRGLELIYKLVLDLEHAVVHYSFTRQKIRDRVHRVPCMSTCGMMMSREIYDRLGGWPAELGIYGGGENFINFTMAIMGLNINIFPANPIYHYAEKRGYHWNYTDFHRNRCIASYMYGGKDFAKKYITSVKGRPEVLSSIYEDVVTKCQEHREHIKKSQKLDIETWCQIWQTTDQSQWVYPPI